MQTSLSASGRRWLKTKRLRIKDQLAMETVRARGTRAAQDGRAEWPSIGFMSKEWSYDRETEVRTLTAIDLWEVSLVTFPANERARVTNVKSADEMATQKMLKKPCVMPGSAKATRRLLCRASCGWAKCGGFWNSTAVAMKSADRLLRSLPTPSWKKEPPCVKQTPPGRDGRSHGCFAAKAQAVGAYEKRDEPSVRSVAEALDKIATAFDEYKKTNDARIEAVKSGASTEALDAKLAKIDAHIDSLGEMGPSWKRWKPSCRVPA